MRLRASEIKTELWPRQSTFYLVGPLLPFFPAALFTATSLIAKAQSNDRFSSVEPTSALASGLPIVQRAAPGSTSTQIE